LGETIACHSPQVNESSSRKPDPGARKDARTDSPAHARFPMSDGNGAVMRPDRDGAEPARGLLVDKRDAGKEGAGVRAEAAALRASRPHSPRITPI